ncbi:uncharacterized protein LOC128549954 [Mercenaria mercenaria]|uniref:uncharacterized protein LOC128549954 n=1 Tax=Mercenaria mercenaria TaxID=6596 RepID=UPI00234FA5A7|nr:uncharacterized protein LOC128549954 [Mercenaria mercenaria]
MRHFDKYQILTNCQHGFRRKRSCETQVLTLVDELIKSLDKGKQHDLAVLDFSKAFDRVPHTDLPLLVLSKSRLFADDCVVYREINTEADCEILQQYLHNLADWEKQWGMSFHPEKCSVLRVHRKSRVNLSWNTHIDKITKKGNSTLGFLHLNLRISNEEAKTTAYISLVRPNLEYCSTAWNPYTKDQTKKLEMVQRRAARYVTNRHHNTSSVATMLDHLQWDTLESRRTKAQLTMLYRIVNNLVDIPAQQHLTPASSRTRSINSRKYRQPSSSTSYYRNSFFPRTITIWNSLPSAIAEAPDLDRNGCGGGSSGGGCGSGSSDKSIGSDKSSGSSCGGGGGSGSCSSGGGSGSSSDGRGSSSGGSEM